MLSRRAVLASLGAVTLLPSLAFAGAPERRLILVLLEGAADGLAICPPWADPDYRRQRGHLALPEPGYPDGVVDLDGYFGLHPALRPIAPWFESGELGLLHAVGLPYEGRSHFDAMDLLEGGGERPHEHKQGWLSRALAASGSHGLAIGAQIPLVLRGQAQVGSIDLSRSLSSDQSFLQAMLGLYQSDPVLGPAYREGLALREELAQEGWRARPLGRRDQGLNAGLARQLGGLLAPNDGPQVAVVQMGGWDTHSYQTRRLSSNLGRLAEGLLSLKQGLGTRWRDTLVLAVTEFGRTVAGNGTLGSDHGTGGVALFAGGAAAGGVVRGDWPGLSRLHQDRDLRVTSDLRVLFSAALEQHLQADAQLALPGVGPASWRLV